MSEVLPEKRRRGRPVGTGIDDSKLLAAVADMLLAHPGMKPTTAMRRCDRGITDTKLRRLQVKWKAAGMTLMAEAKSRRAEAQRVQQQRQFGGAYDVLGMAPRVLQEMLRHPGVQSALERFDALAQSPAMRAAMEEAERQQRFIDMHRPKLSAMAEAVQKLEAQTASYAMRQLLDRADWALDSLRRMETLAPNNLIAEAAKRHEVESSMTARLGLLEAPWQKELRRLQSGG